MPQDGQQGENYHTPHLHIATAWTGILVHVTENTNFHTGILFTHRNSQSKSQKKQKKNGKKEEENRV